MMKVGLQESVIAYSTRAINLNSCPEINWAESDLHSSVRMEKATLSATVWSCPICQNCSQKVNIPNTETLLYNVAHIYIHVTIITAVKKWQVELVMLHQSDIA